MLIKENNNTRQIPNAVATANSKNLAERKNVKSKIPLRVPAPQLHIASKRMPAAKPNNGVSMPLPQKHPIFLPHKPNLSNSRALSPVIPMNGPRSLITNTSGAYNNHAEVGMMKGGYMQGQSMAPQHHSYIPGIPGNIINKHNGYSPSNMNGRGATVINGNGIPLYRQASASSLISTSALKQGNNWKTGLDPIPSSRDNVWPNKESQISSEKRAHQISSKSHHQEPVKGNGVPSKCENKVNFNNIRSCRIYNHVVYVYLSI